MNRRQHKPAPPLKSFAHLYVCDYRSLLLSNHGIVCWADTVSHAEWLVETFDTYCKTYLIAQQIGKPLQYFPENKIQELLEIKRRLGLPDARMRAE
jgi:L-fuculose-phosphate aldolase